MSCCANYEPTRSAMQTSICQKRSIFRIPYFRPSKRRPWKVPPGANAPLAPPRPAATVKIEDIIEDINFHLAKSRCLSFITDICTFTSMIVVDI